MAVLEGWLQHIAGATPDMHVLQGQMGEFGLLE